MRTRWAGHHRVGVSGALILRAGRLIGPHSDSGPHRHGPSQPHGDTRPGVFRLGENCGIVFAALCVHKTAKTARSPFPVRPPPYTR